MAAENVDALIRAGMEARKARGADALDDEAMRPAQVVDRIAEQERALVEAFALAREMLADLGADDVRAKLARLGELTIIASGPVDNDINSIDVEIGRWIDALDDGRAILAWGKAGAAPECPGLERDPMEGCWRLVARGHALCAACEWDKAHPREVQP